MKKQNWESYYVAWLRFADGKIFLCDSDAEGAFKVFRQSLCDEILENAAVIADKHWPESGHIQQPNTVSCAMSISIDIRRMKSTYGDTCNGIRSDD